MVDVRELYKHKRFTKFKNMINPKRNIILLVTVIITIGSLGVTSVLYWNSKKNWRGDNSQYVEKLYEETKGEIVKIYSLGDDTLPAKSGTGFRTHLDSPKIITNKHVVEGQGVVIVETPLKTWIVRKWIEHPILDIAILEIEDSGGRESVGGLEVDCDHIVRPGQKVYTIGYPLGLGLAIHHGLISTTDKGKIVFSAPLSEGASGSPLINQEGKVIGICDSYIPDAQNYNLATPISLAFLTREWIERKSNPDPALVEYIEKISTIKQRINENRAEWETIAKEDPDWEPWVYRTMVTRVPTDQALEHALLAFGAIEWGCLTNASDKAYRIKEAKLLKDCTTGLRKIWEMHKDNLTSNRDLKPKKDIRIDFGLAQTEAIIKSMEETADTLLNFLKGQTDLKTAENNKELKKLILSLGSFRVAEASYNKIGTP